MPRQFDLSTRWQLDSAIERVWDAIVAVDAWPRWWRFVHTVEEVEKGDAEGLGALRRYTWSSKLPYRLSFAMQVTAVTPPTYLEGVAVGDLAGSGRWRLASEAGTTRVRYDWTVVVSKRWMNALAPLLEPAYRWNHNQVMAEGGRGLARHLGVRLLANDGASAR
ncbi:MAG: SRPBCC family protein [Casimicrobiaceae bacterium]